MIIFRLCHTIIVNTQLKTLSQCLSLQNSIKRKCKELDTQKVDMWAKLNQKVASKRDEFKESKWNCG
ncbi:hypothetical protein AHAS_Ahas06G0004900 [Arachis hypogaea]